MQKLPFIFKFFKLYLFFYPLAFESFDLSEYNVILSSSWAFAKGVRKRENQLHICYCHTPMRFVWRYEDYVKRESFPLILKRLLPFMLIPMKKWDLQTARSVDYYIANSRTVAERIKKTYGRESVIINPPVEVDFFKPSALDQDYFLVLSRLNTYKRIDVVVEAFNKLGLALKIVGDGPDRKILQRMADSNIEFLGRRPDKELAKYLAECRAVIFPGEEDFGIVPLEAMCAGRPVIAYKAGGAEETVIDGETGVFFEEQTPESLIRAVKRFQFMTFNKQKIRKYAENFDKTVFKQKVKNFVEEKCRGNL